ncbi:Protein of unknown function (DUF2945) [Streptomyces sp. MnatMP-M77]|uniref:DUF2945 domain-containing protein n=1 Tax=unclassified Streptomyces TaxID=2593676 RepID=UPI0008053BC1|nr:DUF2945 domain-containing protein [Streptomyces sp. MnatMP-M77]SBV05991.1 Protein of unknown function (DUF2945) [Streptomyces sp. MnatMP-M77]
MAKSKKLKSGDSVSWTSHGQTVPGKVKKKITKNGEVAGRTVKATEDEPQYEVESEKSGRTAVHKPQSLRKKSKGS